MKVIVDDKIPYIHSAIEKVADEVVYAPGSQFTPELVKDADALIIRTRTRCNAQLLEGSKVQFVGTATIGYDHIDKAYMAEKGIAWSNCPGCNATSVAQYIYNVLLLLQREKGLCLKQSVLGIVGVGHVGSEVQKAAESLGMTLLLNDPLRAEKEGPEKFASLQQLMEECDVITFHTPLVREGDYATYHLADSAFFSQLKKKPVIINSSRGEVVDNHALLDALESGLIRDAVVDTWENEPEILLPLLEKVYVGTPHVAGYSADGKANATNMVMSALCRHFHLPQLEAVMPPSLPGDFEPSADPEELALQLYNPHHDSWALKKNPEKFEELRGNYPLRREKMHIN